MWCDQPIRWRGKIRKQLEKYLNMISLNREDLKLFNIWYGVVKRRREKSIRVIQVWMCENCREGKQVFLLQNRVNDLVKVVNDNKAINQIRDHIRENWVLGTELVSTDWTRDNLLIEWF